VQLSDEPPPQDKTTTKFMDQLAWYGGLVCGSSQINLLTQPPQKKNVSESGQK
jgi:hypothetical protein